MESKIVSAPHADLILALVELDTAIISPAMNTPSASSSVTPQTPQPRTRKQALNSSDPLYASLRDVNFAIVGTVLNRVARRLSDDYEVLCYYTIFFNKRGGIRPKPCLRSKNSLASSPGCKQSTNLCVCVYLLSRSHADKETPT